jgi:hypothetical protein
MKIFSTFDTQLKNKTLVTEQEKYGKTQVHLLERS